MRSSAAKIIVSGLIITGACQSEKAQSPHQVTSAIRDQNTVSQNSDITPRHSDRSDDTALFGTLNVETNCGQEQISAIADFVSVARSLARSSAFRQCMTDGIRYGISTQAGGLRFQIGPYMPCAGDPLNGKTEDIISSLDQFLASPNSMLMKCNFGSNGAEFAIAEAFVGHLGHTGAETMSWRKWLLKSNPSHLIPHCFVSNTSPCTNFALPWPYDEGASAVLHEISHTHGFKHGDASQQASMFFCGRTEGSDGYEYQRNSIPYIISSCSRFVLHRSAMQCSYGFPGTGFYRKTMGAAQIEGYIGKPITRCGSNNQGVFMIRDLTSPECDCVEGLL